MELRGIASGYHKCLHQNIPMKDTDNISEKIKQPINYSDMNFYVALNQFKKSNQHINIDYDNAHIPSISESVSNELKHHALMIQKEQKINQNIDEMITGEYETWQLLNELIFIDTLYFKNQDKKVDKLCPKTAEYWQSVKSHSNLVILAVTHWLEKIYNMDVRSSQLETPTNSTRSSIEDFDSDYTEPANQSMEMTTLRGMFEHLRGGQMMQLQT